VELERLGALTGLPALALRANTTGDDNWAAPQRRNRFAFVVIGQNWKGGAEGLKHLQAVPGLRGVSFSHSDFCDDWAECLRKIDGLKEVYIQGEKFTDKGMQSLRHFKGLEALSLLGTGVTDKGLACVEEMTEMRWLCLAMTDVSDDGLAHLRRMKELRRLNLDSSSTSGEGMAHLKDATKLEWLRLSGMLVIHEERPDARTGLAALRHLHGMKQLKYLSIGSMMASPEEMQTLLKAVKGLKSIDTQYGKMTRAKLQELEKSFGGLNPALAPPMPAKK
jgi:hypothetical protein